MLLLAASLLCCTKEKETITPELLAFNATPTPFSVTLMAKIHNAKYIKEATFVVRNPGDTTIMRPATFSGDTLTATIEPLHPNRGYYAALLWATANVEYSSPTYRFYTDPYPMPRIPSMTITPGAYDAEVRFHFLDEEYLRDYWFYCWKEGTGGAYNTAQTSYVKEGNEFICTVTNLDPETYYEFHASYSNIGAIGNEYSMRFKTLPAPFHITVTQKVEPSYFSTTLSADFTADVDYTPCGFMYRKFFTEDWTTVQVTPENNHLELVVTDFEQSTEYEFMVFYTVDGEVYQTDSRYFKTPEVPMPAITSMTVDIDGTSAILQADIREVEFVTSSGFTLMYGFGATPDGAQTWTEKIVEVPLVEGHMTYVWESLTPGERYGFRTFRTNAYEKRETDPVFFTIPLE